MTRTALVVLLMMLAACSNSGSTDSGDRPANDAEAFKTEMDAFARETLPELEAEVGGEWSGFDAKFFEMGGNTGQWDYSAAGGASKPPGSGDEVLDKVEGVLRAQGMEITRPGPVSDIAARRGNISVQVQRGLLTDVESVSTLRVEFSSIDRLTSADDFAEDADTTGLLK